MIDILTVGMAPTFVPYRQGWDLQRELHAEIAGGTRRDTLLLLEHEAVYTAGARTARHERPVDGTPVVDVDRGGKITWHGPGQLVGYPLVRLPEPVDVVAHVRRLEDLLIAVAETVGVAGVRVDGRSGVWVDVDGVFSKVAAIGVRVQRGVTMHGFALNCDNTLEPFERIIPCGITDAGVTTLSDRSGRRITPADILPAVAEAFAAEYGSEVAA
ncbi:lipoyl(octanoyl) transferase LipB [Microbacterium oleivorans]|uniref:lipoyl(octanoyl) transferase LipB n=1 Tax=Microbacterium TaxID=33882 RepID=UPI00203E0264|nr:lipoyl(octanoyl) transferase LipB [Microbacterium oleivorans]MCM3696827.1 lipoyl(octanoyl) transferase LipB [Microbacterium oleivorans]